MKILLPFVIVISFVSSIYTQETMDSLLCFLPFNGNSMDESGNENDALVFEASLTTDRFGKANSAYFLDGESSYLKICNNSLELSYSSTISFWFKPMDDLSSNDDPQIFMQSDVAGDIDGHFLIGFNRTNCLQYPSTSDGKINFEVQGDSQNANSENCSRFGLTRTSSLMSNWNKDEWYMVTVVVDDGVLSFYINGEFEDSHPSSSGVFLSNQDIIIGAYVDFPQQDGSYFHGAIDDVAIYNKGLSQEEIEDLYISMTSNVVNIPNNFEIEIFPNPFVEDINVKVENYDHPYYIELCNINGQTLEQYLLSDKEHNLHLDIGSGIYLVVLKSRQGELIAQRKLIKY